MNNCNSLSLMKINVSMCDIGEIVNAKSASCVIGCCRQQNKVVAEAVPTS